jgi:hypothetical protein
VFQVVINSVWEITAVFMAVIRLATLFVHIPNLTLAAMQSFDQSRFGLLSLNNAQTPGFA